LLLIHPDPWNLGALVLLTSGADPIPGHQFGLSGAMKNIRSLLVKPPDNFQ